MTDRLKSVRRLSRLQEQVKRIAEAELQAAKNRTAAIEDAALDLDAFIGDADRSPRLVKIAMAQRGLLAVRLAQAQRSVEEQTLATDEARSRSRLAERMVEDLTREEARIDERKDLERLIEGMAGRAPDSGL